MDLGKVILSLYKKRAKAKVLLSVYMIISLQDNYQSLSYILENIFTNILGNTALLSLKFLEQFQYDKVDRQLRLYGLEFFE